MLGNVSFSLRRAVIVIFSFVNRGHTFEGVIITVQHRLGLCLVCRRSQVQIWQVSVSFFYFETTEIFFNTAHHTDNIIL